MADLLNTDGAPKFFDSVIDGLKAAAPEGASVRVIGYDGADKIARLGYRLCEDEADVVIACGDATAMEKARAFPYRRLIVCPVRDVTYAVCGLIKKIRHGFLTVQRGDVPFGAVIDRNELDLPAVFGELVSLELAAFDMSFSAAMSGENATGLDFTATTERLLNNLKDLGKDSAKKSAVIADEIMRIAPMVLSQSEVCYISSANQAAQAYRMLCTAEDRALATHGETEFIIGGYVADFYVKALMQRAAFPPDNNRRIDSLCTYFGTDVRRAALAATPLFNPKKLALTEYRLDEYRSELMRALSPLIRRRTQAFNIFKRLYPDDGFSIRSKVDTADLPLCIALAPDVFPADTPLSYFKQTGNLERYIV